jgi:hypothetical protein
MIAEIPIFAEIPHAIQVRNFREDQSFRDHGATCPICRAGVLLACRAGNYLKAGRMVAPRWQFNCSQG